MNPATVERSIMPIVDTSLSLDASVANVLAPIPKLGTDGLVKIKTDLITGEITNRVLCKFCMNPCTRANDEKLTSRSQILNLFALVGLS